VLHLIQGRELLRPSSAGGDAVDLVELVPVVIGAQQELAVVTNRDGAHCVVGERRQLIRRATVHADAPEVELPGCVADEEDTGTVGRERDDGVEPPVREELFKGRCHAASLLGTSREGVLGA
jgi:hypothetical protein